MANRMQDLRDLLQGDAPERGRQHLLGGDLLGDLLGEMDGDVEGDLLGELLGADPVNAARGVWNKQRHPGMHHLSPQDIAFLRAMIARKRAQGLNVRQAPPLVNGLPGVPQTTQSRGFLPFFALGGATPYGQVTGPVTNPTIIFQAQPQRPVRLHRLVGSRGYTPAAAESDPTVPVITEIKVGQTSLFAGEGGIPLDMFKPEVMNSQFDGVSAGPGVSITITCQVYGTLVAGAKAQISLGAYADQVI